MQLSDIISENMVFTELEGKSKKQVLLEACDLLAKSYQLNSQEIFELFIERERLGSTGVGRGVAIPHIRIKGISKPQGVFLKLNNAIDFDSVDRQPVDLIFALLAPEDSGTDHLKALSIVSRTLKDREFCNSIKTISDPKKLYQALLEESQKS